MAGKGEKEQRFPRWCDLRCPWAELPGEKGIDGSGSCRTFSALYCSAVKRYVLKNAPCALRGNRRGKKAKNDN